MQSPFKILRRFQKVVLACLAVMAMIAFGVGDQLIKMTGRGVSGEGVVVESTAGDLTQQGLNDLMRRRHIANVFMYRALVAANPQYESLVRFAPGIMYHFGPEAPQQVHFAWLLRHEAERLGVVVDDDQIRSYIREATRSVPGFEQFFSGGKKLNAEQFAKVLQEMQISAKDLYDALRDELASQMALRLLAPVATMSPEQYWELYQKIHTRQKIEVAPLPLDEFAATIEPPTEPALANFFDAHKNRFESASGGEFRPGFRQSPKVRLQYLQLTYLDIQERVLKDQPVTDKDIEEYYEARKTLDRRLQDFDAPSAEEGADSDAPIEPGFAPEGEPRPQSPDRPSGPSGGSSEPESNCGGDEPATAADDSSKPESKPEDTPATNAAVTNAEGQPENQNDDKSDVATQPPEGTSDAARGTDATDADEATKPKKPAVRPLKFKPLDDELRSMIRESIVHERTLERMKGLATQAADALRDAGLRLSQQGQFDLTRPKREDAERVMTAAREAMQGVGQKLGLTYGETELLNDRQLSELPGIGKAEEPNANQFAPGGVRTVVDMVFGNESLCQVLEAESSGPASGSSRDRYVFWKVQHDPEHVPTLDEPGVREQVIKAWKLQQALPDTLKRAEQLKELVEKSKEPMSAVLSGQTVTGAANALAVTVKESPEFSWWRESSAPDPGMREPLIQLSNPIVVTNAGPKFMEYVFSALHEGDVGVALNDDASNGYVVKVVSRRPADREAFKNAPLYNSRSPYASLAQREQEGLFRDFIQQLDKTYAVRWRTTENAVPETPTDDY